MPCQTLITRPPSHRLGACTCRANSKAQLQGLEIKRAAAARVCPAGPRMVMAIAARAAAVPRLHAHAARALHQWPSSSSSGTWARRGFSSSCRQRQLRSSERRCTISTAPLSGPPRNLPLISTPIRIRRRTGRSRAFGDGRTKSRRRKHEPLPARRRGRGIGNRT